MPTHVKCFLSSTIGDQSPCGKEEVDRKSTFTFMFGILTFVPVPSLGTVKTVFLVNRPLRGDEAAPSTHSLECKILLGSSIPFLSSPTSPSVRHKTTVNYHKIHNVFLKYCLTIILHVHIFALEHFLKTFH